MDQGEVCEWTRVRVCEWTRVSGCGRPRSRTRSQSTGKKNSSFRYIVHMFRWSTNDIPYSSTVHVNMLISVELYHNGTG